MNDNTKLEIAKELIASKVGKAALLGLTTKDEELQQLIKLKEEVDNGNMETIERVLRISKPKKKVAND
jgi:hypothetical protein